MNKTTINLHKFASSPFLIVSFFLTAVLILITVSCKRSSQDFVPFIVSTNEGLLVVNTPTLNKFQGEQTVSTSYQEPRLTLTLAPISATPTPMSPQTLPTLRANADLYTIQSGDSLAGIALKNQVSVQQIVAANEIEDSNLSALVRSSPSHQPVPMNWLQIFASFRIQKSITGLL